MKKVVLFLGLVLLLSTAGLAEEVFKEDFEGDISAWKTSNYTNALTMGVVSGGAGGSNQAYEIRRDAGKTDIAFGLTSPAFEVKEGKTYILSVEMKNSYNTSKPIQFGKEKGPANKIFWLDLNGNKISEQKIVGFGAPNEEWHTVKIPAPAPANAARAQIKFATDWPDIFGGLYWRIDNIKFFSAD